jgi:hypothetical protein
MHTPGHTPACVTYVMGDTAFPIFKGYRRIADSISSCSERVLMTPSRHCRSPSSKPSGNGPLTSMDHQRFMEIKVCRAVSSWQQMAWRTIARGFNAVASEPDGNVG